MKRIKIENLTAAIMILRREAAEAGDESQVRMCDRALDGSKRARKGCEKVLREALAQQEH